MKYVVVREIMRNENDVWRDLRLKNYNQQLGEEKNSYAIQTKEKYIN